MITYYLSVHVNEPKFRAYKAESYLKKIEKCTADLCPGVIDSGFWTLQSLQLLVNEPEVFPIHHIQKPNQRGAYFLCVIRAAVI